NIHRRGKVATSCLDGKERALFSKIFPETQNSRAHLLHTRGIEFFAIENFTRNAPGGKRITKTIGEPDIVEAHIGEEMLALPTQESSERGAFRNAGRKACIFGIIAMQHG